MNSNYFQMHDKITAGRDNKDRDDDVTALKRCWRWITGTDETTHEEKSTRPGYTTNAKLSEHTTAKDDGLADIKNSDIAKRLLHIAVLAICYFIVEFIAKAVTVIQLIFVAWKKRPHPGLRRLGATIAQYMSDLWCYCTFASDNPPWPFRQ